VLIDPIEGEAMSMEPLYDLFRHEATVKVFHAARQDLEIFFVEGGVFPKPLFDTQVAAMVCGFGEQVGYETLVKRSPRPTSTRPAALPTGRAARCPRRRRTMPWPMSPICG
jgi:ribonuclease D